MRYDLDVRAKLQKEYASFTHLLCPYAIYRGLTSPTLSPDDSYIFSVADGLEKLHLLRTGLCQRFYLRGSSLFAPHLTIDLYAYSFFHAPTFRKTTPKFGSDLTWSFPSIFVFSKLLWNHEEHLFDLANVGVAWTLSRSVAIKMEFRHRSRFYWRRNSPENFIMEVTRPIAQLLASPLSDGRNTVVSRLQAKLAPEWTVQFASHIGWGRRGSPSYHAFQIDLFTTLSSSWQVHASLTHSPAPEKKDTRFLLSISLGPKPKLHKKLGSL